MINNLNDTTSGIWKFLLDFQTGLYDNSPINENEQYSIYEFSKAIEATQKELNEIIKLIDR